MKEERAEHTRLQCQDGPTGFAQEYSVVTPVESTTKAGSSKTGKPSVALST